MYIPFACPESANGVGEVRVNTNQVLPATKESGEVDERCRNILLGEPETESSVSIVESFDADGMPNFKDIKMTNAQIAAAYEAYQPELLCARRAAEPAVMKVIKTANETINIYLNNVSVDMILKEVSAYGEEVMYVSFACPESANGVGRFRADMNQVLPANKKRGEAAEKYRNIFLGEPETERSVSIVESFDADGNSCYKTIKMTNEQIAAAYEDYRQEWLREHRAAEPAIQTANETKNIFLNGIPADRILKEVSPYGEELIYVTLNHFSESAVGFALLRVDMNQVFPAPKKSGEVDERYRNILLGKPETERDVSIVEFFDDDADMCYKTIKMTNAQISFFYYSESLARFRSRLLSGLVPPLDPEQDWLVYELS